MSLYRKVLKVTLVRLPLLFLDYFLVFFKAGIWFNVVDKRSERKKIFNWKTGSIFFKGRVIDKNTCEEKGNSDNRSPVLPSSSSSKASCSLNHCCEVPRSYRSPPLQSFQIRLKQNSPEFLSKQLDPVNKEQQ